MRGRGPCHVAAPASGQRQGRHDGVTHLSGEFDCAANLRRRGIGSVAGVAKLHAIGSQNDCFAQPRGQSRVGCLNQCEYPGQVVCLREIDLALDQKCLEVFLRCLLAVEGNRIGDKGTLVRQPFRGRHIAIGLV